MENPQNRLASTGLKVVDHITAMLAYWDKDLVCRFANSAYVDWFGKSREEMVDKMTISELLGPSLFEKNLPYIQGVLRGEVQTFEREIPLPQGGSRFSLANYFPDIVDGTVKGFFVHVADITKVKLLEHELMQTNQVIKEQNERLLNFSNIVSHNLKSYATNLKSLLDFLSETKADEEREKLQGYLHSLSNGFTTTVNHLIQIVQVQHQHDLKSESISIYNYIEQTIDILKMDIASSHAIIQNKVDKKIALPGNPAYFESIFLNLISNAIKYRHPERDPFITLDSLVQENQVSIRIKDNGRGINLKKNKGDLFGLHKTFHGNADAQGIGLYITKCQVETMKGNIEVNSEEYVGTTFTITFPYQA